MNYHVMCEVTSGDNRLRRRLTSPCLQSTDGNTAKLTCSVVMSRFDYCDTVFFGAFSTTVDILQLTQKQPARSRLSSVRLATAASVAPLAATETANPPQDVTANTHSSIHIVVGTFDGTISKSCSSNISSFVGSCSRQNMDRTDRARGAFFKCGSISNSLLANVRLCQDELKCRAGQ